MDARVSHLSIRPEFRYGRWTSLAGDWEDTVLFSRNQFEFLIGISLHPFRFKSGHRP
jgi:hypothetical protein